VFLLSSQILIEEQNKSQKLLYGWVKVGACEPSSAEGAFIEASTDEFIKTSEFIASDFLYM